MYNTTECGVLANGCTIQYGDNRIYTGVVEGDFVAAPEQEKEVIAHELGHAIDHAIEITQPQPSHTTTYNLFVLNDYLNLDYSYVGVDQAHSTLRDPCNGADAALTGVYDYSTFSYFCTGSSLTNPGYYDGLTNSAIVQQGDPLVLSPNSSANQWPEVYAQAFAYADYAWQNVGTISNLEHPTFDTLMSNSQMPCTLAWADQIVIDGTVPPTSPSYCSNSIPGWYTPFQDLP